MLNIDLESLINNAKELESLIYAYENNTMTISRELQNSEMSWHDENSGLFFDKISALKIQLAAFIENLKNLKIKYRSVIEEVKRIDRNIKKLFVDFNQEEIILNSYGYAINKLNEVKNKIRYTNINFCTYQEQNKIKNEYSRINKCIRNLESSKKRVSSMFNKTSDLEAKILSSFAKVSMNSIKEIDY